MISSFEIQANTINLSKMDKVERIGMEKEFSFLVYQTADEEVSVNSFIKNGTVWLTAFQISMLFEKPEERIQHMLRRLFENGELDKTQNARSVQLAGASKPLEFFDLDAIVKIGGFINSGRAKKFRKWIAGVLRDYMLKGYALDEERMQRSGDAFGKDFVEEARKEIEDLSRRAIQ